MEIRKAEFKDLQEIILLNKIIDYENPDEFMRESIEKGNVYIALEDNKVIGFLLFQFIWGNAPLLALLKIHPNFQKQSVGTQLISRGEKALVQKGYTQYYSSTGDDNEGSQIFHNKLGFDKVGQLDMKFGTEIFYKKEL